MKAREVEPFIDLHNVEFYNPVARAILHMKCDQKTGLLAIGRSDNTIEIWNIRGDAPVMVKLLCSTKVGRIEGICWIQRLLFTVDSEGQLAVWDLKTLEVSKILRVTGSAGTCVATNCEETIVVVGTEEGYLNLFSVSEENGVMYQKVMDKQEGRIVCVSFDPTGKFLASGSLDCVRVWDATTGHVIHKMTLPRIEQKKETIVWCLTMLENLTVITGDSRGRLTIWDGNLGTQLTSYGVSKADILSLIVTDNGETLYCSGVDPDIKTYKLVSLKKEDQTTKQWVRSISRCIHSHDVHALETYQKRLYSGGQDAFLTVSSYPPKTVNRYGPFLSKPSVTIAEDNRLVLLKYTNYLEIWKLGVANAKNIDAGDSYALKETPKKLLEMKSKHGNILMDAKISPNGEWIAYTTMDVIKIFRFNYSGDKKPELSDVELPPEIENSRLITFNPDSSSIFISKSNNQIHVFSLNYNTITHQQTIDVSQHLTDTIRQIQISSCGHYLSCLAGNNDIAILKIDKKKWKHVLNLPRHKFCITSFGFRPNSSSIVVAFANQKLFEYDYEEMKFVLSTMVDCGNNRQPISGIVFDPRKSDSVLLHTELGIHALRRMTEDDDDDCEPGLHVKRYRKVGTSKDVEGQTIVRTVKSYEHLINLSWLGEHELIAVHMKGLQFVEQLPPALRQKKFGIS